MKDVEEKIPLKCTKCPEEDHEGFGNVFCRCEGRNIALAKQLRKKIKNEHGENEILEISRKIHEALDGHDMVKATTTMCSFIAQFIKYNNNPDVARKFVFENINIFINKLPEKEEK